MIKEEEMDLNKENIKKIMKIIAFGIILYFALQNLGMLLGMVSNLLKILSPFLVGAGLAFVLNLPMGFFERKFLKPKKLKNGEIKQNKLKRILSIFMALILVILIISFVIQLVIPQLISVIIMFFNELPGFVYDLKEWAMEITEQYPDISSQIQGIEINWDKIINDAIILGKNMASGFVSSTFGFVVSLIGGIFDTIVAIVFAIYILMSKEKLNRQLKKIVRAYLPEKKAKHVLEIGSLSNRTFCNFITGQCIEAVILGVLCFLGMLIFRLPFAATISVLVGVTALIPIIGCFMGIIIGAILILSIAPIKSVIFIVFLIVLQQIETNVIYPKVVGNSVGLPGMWVLVAVVVGGSLGGMLGLLLGLPIVSILYTIFRDDVNQRLEDKKNP